MINEPNEQAAHKSDIFALIWSIAMPGLGHLYLGNKIIGILFIAYTGIFMIFSELNNAIFYAFAGDFQKANSIFAESPSIFFPAVYSFAIWHAYNYDVIVRKGRSSEYKLTGFFFGLLIGGVPGSSQQFLGTYIFTGLVVGIISGILFHLVEKLIVTQLKKS
ncbi:hypothetical protein [Paenibacillus sp. P36]|uniref:hypothetical protein n=1 Tax=Paenibacillus sp. P36 TaxID=3342538 RepID=UPI0038B251AF